MRIPPAMRAMAAVAACAGVLVLEGEASARDRGRNHPDKDYYTPHPVRSVYGLHAWWWSASVVGSTFPFLLYGTNEFTSNVFFDFEVPWTFTADSDLGAASTVAAVGNPTLVVRYAERVDDSISWTVGGGLSGPMGAIEDDEGNYPLALALGSAGTALQRPYLWALQSLPVVARAGLELRLARPLFLRGQLEPLVAIPLDGQDVVVASEQRVEFEARVPQGVGGGLSLQATTIFVPADGDQAQLSTEAFFSYDDEETFFFRLGVLLALDEQLGFGFDEGKVLTGHVLVGGYFEEDE